MLTDAAGQKFALKRGQAAQAEHADARWLTIMSALLFPLWQETGNYTGYEEEERGEKDGYG
jgi:hypothetical protein